MCNRHVVNLFFLLAYSPSLPTAEYYEGPEEITVSIIQCNSIPFYFSTRTFVLFTCIHCIKCKIEWSVAQKKKIYSTATTIHIVNDESYILSFRADTTPIIDTRVGWKVHRLTLMLWSNLTKCGLFFNIVSPAVHTFLPSVLQCLHSCGIGALILILGKSPQLQIWPYYRSDPASQPNVFSCWGTENRLCQIRRIWRVINQFNELLSPPSYASRR